MQDQKRDGGKRNSRYFHSKTENNWRISSDAEILHKVKKYHESLY